MNIGNSDDIESFSRSFATASVSDVLFSYSAAVEKISTDIL